MDLPEGFNEWEHLQSVVRRAQNESVRDFYRDQQDNDIGSSKGAVRHACLIKDDDTATMVLIRMWLYWVFSRKMRDNFEPYAGFRIPSDEQSVKHRPHVTIYFIEDFTDVAPNDRAVEGQISFRLVNETSESLTQTKLQQLANRIVTEFDIGDGYVWNKGKSLFSYADKANGHRHKILATNQTAAVALLRKVLEVSQTSYDADLLRENTADNPSSAFPSNPGTDRILGEQRRKARSRPVANVRFLYAQIKISGIPNPVILVDKSGHWSNALIRSW